MKQGYDKGIAVVHISSVLGELWKTDNYDFATSLTPTN